MKKVKVEVTVYFPEDIKYISVLPDADIVGFMEKPAYEPCCNQYVGVNDPVGHEYGLYPENLPREDEDKAKLYKITESGLVEVFDAMSIEEFNYRDAYSTTDLIGADGIPLTQEQFVAGLKKHFGVEFK
jgi:hypothetical protein